MKRTLARTSVLLLLALVISTPSFAAGHSPGPQEGSGFLSGVWQFLGSLLPGFDKARGSMDPDGTPAPPPEGGTNTTPPEDDGDGRASLDPNG